LLGADLATAQLRQQADKWAAAHGVVLVLKGHRTIVTDGKQHFENTTGNPGMATAGSGDVLTGIIAALLGQGLSPFAAAQLAVYLHGLAGDLAAATLGQVALLARDIIDYLPAAFCHHAGDHEAPTA
jgi:NAD(P)H-hydrate epimerase